MSAPTAILVPVVANATTAPLVLADNAFLERLSKAEQQVGALAIKDAETNSLGVSLLNDLTLAASRLEKSRVELKAPFLEIGRMIDECARTPAKRIETLKGKVRAQLQTFEAELRKAAEKAERERQAEIARLEQEKARQEEEARKKAEAAAALAAPTDLDFDEGPAPEAPKTAIEKKIEALKYPVAPAVPTPAGVRFRVTLVAVVDDVAKLPDAFVTRVANEKLIRETYCVGYKDGQPVPSLPGVVFKVDRTPIPTGKTGIELF